MDAEKKEYSIVSFVKLKTNGNIVMSAKHNNRTIPVPNADPEKLHLNQLDGMAGKSNKELTAHINDRISKCGRNPRPDSVKVIDVVITASPEFFDRATPDEVDDFFKSSKQWVTDKFGSDNVMASWVHLDEKTPHLHVFVTPMMDKEHINKHTKAKTTALTLNASHWIDGQKKCAELHTSFNNAVKHLGLSRGEEFSSAKKKTAKQWALEQAALVKDLEAQKAHVQELKTQLVAQRVKQNELAAEQRATADRLHDLEQSQIEAYNNNQAALIQGSEAHKSKLEAIYAAKTRDLNKKAKAVELLDSAPWIAGAVVAMKNNPELAEFVAECVSNPSKLQVVKSLVDVPALAPVDYTLKPLQQVYDTWAPAGEMPSIWDAPKPAP
jgi:hypothetical protein